MRKTTEKMFREGESENDGQAEDLKWTWFERKEENRKRGNHNDDISVKINT